MIAHLVDDLTLNNLLTSVIVVAAAIGLLILRTQPHRPISRSRMNRINRQLNQREGER